MKIVIRKPKYDLWTIVISAYLINQFYFKELVSVQRIIFLGLLAAYVFINFSVIINIARESKKKKSRLDVSILVFLIWFLIVCLTPYISGSHDYSYISYCITFFSWLFYLLAINIRIRKKNPDADILVSFMELFILSMVLYVLSTIIILLVPGLRSFILNIVSNSEKQQMLLEREKYYTRIGWAGFSGYSTSLKCTIAICFALYLIIKDVERGTKVGLKKYLTLALLLVGNVFYARTGMLLSIVCVVVAIGYIAFVLGRIGKFFKYLLLVLILGSIGIFALNAYSGNNAVVEWMFETFIRYESGRGFGSISTSIIFNDMLFRIDGKTLAFGDGFYTSPGGGYYMSTDLGFMRLLLYFGVLGALIIYGLFIYMLRSASIIDGSRGIGSLYILLFITFLGFEFKGESIVILVPLAFSMLLMSRKKDAIE